MKDEDLLYHTLIGSMITVVGIISGKTEKDNLRYFRLLRKRIGKDKKQYSPYEVWKKVWNEYNHENKNPSMRKQVVLLTDKLGVRTPMVALCIDSTIMPLKSDGEYTGILRVVGNGNVNVEYMEE